MSVATGYLQDAARCLAEGTGWAGLGGDALAYVLGRVAAQGRWLIVVDAADRRDRLVRALRFFHPEPSVIEAFPGDDNRPYDGFSPDPELPAQRARALFRVGQGGPCVIVADVRALQQRVPTADVLAAGTVVLEPRRRLDRDPVIRALRDGGYLQAGSVEGPGTFAVRGDVVDVWPAAGPFPARIDFFDDEVEGLRRLDPETRRPAGPCKRLVLLPAREERTDAAALARLHDETARWLSTSGEGHAVRRRVIDELQAGVRFSGLGDWLPALVPTDEPLARFSELRWVVSLPDDVSAAARDGEAAARRRWEQLDPAEERPLVPPEARWVPADTLLAQLRSAHRVYPLGVPGRSVDLGASAPEGFALRGTDLNPVAKRLRDLLDDDVRVGLVVESEHRAGKVLELLEPYHLPFRRVAGPQSLPTGEIGLLVGDLPTGFFAPASGVAFLPVSALFGGGAAASRKSERIHALFERGITQLSQLKAGDPVVHRVHGIGRYLGLQRMAFTRPEGPADGTGASFRQISYEQDFVKLQYRDDALLFLPVTSLEQLSAYTPASHDSDVTLDRLGGQTWAARKAKVRDRLLERADELLRTFAKRELAERPPIDVPGSMYQAFEAQFPYDETPDQQAAIDAVRADLAASAPMDRLICGDVGFGKTEVAMRAAMLAVEAGRQVAVLCPTTVLALQHLRTFQERFAPFPVRIAMLSRFNSPAEERAVREGLADRSIDIVVGTTALLGARIRIPQLGLLVVDEEHRFGVRQKERLKKMRAEVDILSMSATPIPRTLHLALSGLRAISVISTPPRDRLSVRTSIARFSESRVRDAMLQELERGGQVFFVHNDIETLPRTAEALREWVPEARFAVAHGQMDEDALEQVLVDFVGRRFDVLVCTAIVESGIHMPTVNTILVHRADRFGLAQLYQLRGRVGRAHVRGNCLLLVPDVLTSDARRRLGVLTEHAEIGTGFQVAAADLELRGGGNFLGTSQSGSIDEVGYDTWLSLLEDAVHEVRGEHERSEVDPEVEVPVPAFIPEDLLADPTERLGWYRRLSGAASVGEVDGLADELEGFLGVLPEPLQNLVGLMATRALCRDWGVERLRWLKVRAVLGLHVRSRIDAARARVLVERHPKRFEFRWEGDQPVELSIRFTPSEAEHPFRYLRWVFAQLARAGEAVRAAKAGAARTR
jgi:transcription-repair coupling factor (superfamily II helicase)